MQGEKVVQLGTAFTVGIVMARYLGPDEFGIWSFAIAVATIGTALGRWGLDTITLHDFSTDLVDPGLVLGTTLAIRGLCTAFFCTAAGVIALVVVDADAPILVLLGLVLPAAVFRSADSVVLLHIVKKRARRVFAVRSAALLTGGLIKIGLVYTGAPLTVFGAAVLLETFVLAFLCLMSTKGTEGERLRVSLTEARRLLRAGLPLLASSVGSLINHRTDVIMLAALAGSAEVGLYSVAVRLSEAWYVIPITLFVTIIPHVTRAAIDRNDTYERGFRLLQQAIILILYGFSFAIFFAAEPLISLLFGSEYEAASSVFSLYILSTVLVFLGYSSSFWFVRAQQNWVMPIRAWTGAVLNVIGNLLLVPHYGAIGAAFATIAAHLVSDCLLHAVISSYTRHVLRLQIRALLLLDVSLLWREGTRRFSAA